jgi:hypothetical protein
VWIQIWFQRMLLMTTIYNPYVFIQIIRRIEGRDPGTILLRRQTWKMWMSEGISLCHNNNSNTLACEDKKWCYIIYPNCMLPHIPICKEPGGKSLSYLHVCASSYKSGNAGRKMKHLKKITQSKCINQGLCTCSSLYPTSFNIPPSPYPHLIWLPNSYWSSA